MEYKNALCGAIKKVAWGYVFIYLDFNLGTLNILPKWVGYLLLLSSFSIMAEDEPDMKRLYPFGIGITIYEVFLWIYVLFGGMETWYVIDIIVGIIRLYFHFCFLTHLAGIAGKYGCPEKDGLLKLRIGNVVCVVLTWILSYTYLELLTVIVLLLNLVMIIWTLLLCFKLHRSMCRKME